MRLKLWLANAAIACLLIPQYAGASTVFETTGWITDDTGLIFEFDADVAPFTYMATLADLSEEPFFGFDFLFLSITTSTESLGSIFGPGSFTFTAIPGETYFANIFGTGGGSTGAGLFGLEIAAVPIPPAIWLFGTGILGLIAVARRKKRSA